MTALLRRLARWLTPASPDMTEPNLAAPSVYVAPPARPGEAFAVLVHVDALTAAAVGPLPAGTVIPRFADRPSGPAPAPRPAPAAPGPRGRVPAGGMFHADGTPAGVPRRVG